MPTLKGLLFSQYAAEGLSALVEEMQSSYTAKKGADLIMIILPTKLVVLP